MLRPSLANLCQPVQQRAARLWACPGLLTRPRIESSARMTRSLGRCYPERDLIRVTASLGKLEASLVEEIITHELAHLAVHWRHGRGARPHGGEWRALMTAAGLPARAKLPADSACLPPTKRVVHRFLHRCPVCGASRPAGRPVKEWRCAHCRSVGLDGQLNITRIGPRIEVRSPNR